MAVNEETFSILLSSLCIVTLTIFCAFLRVFKRRFLPSQFQIFVEELVCTFQIVAGVKEGDIVLDTGGTWAYFVFIFVLFASFGLSFEGNGATCGLWEQLFFGQISIVTCLIACILQLIGGFIGLVYIKSFWKLIGLGSYHLKMYKHSTEDICESAMNSTLYEGMVAEFTATILFSIYSNSLRNLSLISTGKRSAYFDAFVTSFIVIVGMDYTGMMFNPALASALTYNCKGHSVSEHILVYWFAPFLATVVSCIYFNYQKKQTKEKKAEKKD